MISIINSCAVHIIKELITPSFLCTEKTPQTTSTVPEEQPVIGFRADMCCGASSTLPRASHMWRCGVPKSSRYLQLSDREWLHHKYVDEKLSSVAISKVVGCTPGAVISALYRSCIKTRSCSTSAKMVIRKFKSTLLNDPEWLRSRYYDDKLTTYEIAKLAGTSQKSVMGSLEKHGIARRSMSEAATLRAWRDLSGENKTYFRKFPKLEDAEWLQFQYESLQRSCSDISEELLCSPTNVYHALSRRGIQARTNSQAQRLVEHQSSYSLLNNVSEMHRLYVKEKKSTIEISKLAGAKSCNSVRQSLIRNMMEVRNYREAQIHSREDEGFICSRTVIDGGMLGDAGLKIYNKDSDVCAPCYYRRNKYRAHVLWVANQVVSNFVEDHILLERYQRDGKELVYHYFSTQTHDSLKPFFVRWYPKDNPYDSCKHYTKIIPEDVDISPLSLLHCFLDDGTTYRRRIESPTKQVYAQLCLQGFTRDNLEMFCQKVKREYGHSLNIKTRPCYTGYGYLLEISQGSYQAFLDIIGPCPEELVSCFGYKWK